MKLITFLEKISELAGGFKITEEMLKLGKSYTKGTTKTVTKEKDPDAPKRPNNEYILFSQEMRASVKDKNKTLGPKEITAKLAEMWRAEKEKNSKVYKEYQQKLAAKKVIYEKEKSEYEQSHVYASDDDGKDGKGKEKKAGKKLSTYNLFCSANLKIIKGKFPDKPPKELMGLVAAEWKKLSDEQKKSYTGAVVEVKATETKPVAKTADTKAADTKAADTKAANAKTADKKQATKVIVKDSTELDSDDDTPPPPKKTGKAGGK